MTAPLVTPLVFRVLRAFADADDRDGVFWANVNTTDGTMVAVAVCSDQFAWGTVDAEPIETEADVELLEATLADLAAMGETEWLSNLYAARRRQRRPMRQFLDVFNNPLLAMAFLACGPDPTENR